MNEIIDYVMNSPQNTNPNVLKGLLESFASGGGGDSDFTTAEVTFVRTAGASGSTAFWGAWAYDAGERSLMHNMFTPASVTTATLVLYKGKAIINPDDFSSITAITATGDAEVDSNYFDVFITGDCTITFSTK